MLLSPTQNTQDKRSEKIKSVTNTIVAAALIFLVVVLSLPAYLAPTLHIGTISFIGSQSRVWFLMFSIALSAAAVFNFGVLVHKLNFKRQTITISLIIFAFLNVGLTIAQAVVIDASVAREHNILAGVFTAHAIVCIFLFALLIVIKNGLKKVPFVVFCLTPLLAVGGLNIYIWFGVHGHTIAFYQAALLFTALLTVFLLQEGETYGELKVESGKWKIKVGDLVKVLGAENNRFLPNEVGARKVYRLAVFKKVAGFFICFLPVMISILLTYDAFMSPQLHINTFSSFGERNRDWFVFFSVSLSISLILNLATLSYKLPFKRRWVRPVMIGFLGLNIVLALLQAYIIDWSVHTEHIVLAGIFTAHSLISIFIFVGFIIKFNGLKGLPLVIIYLLFIIVTGILNLRMIFIMGGVISFWQMKLVYACLCVVFFMQNNQKV